MDELKFKVALQEETLGKLKRQIDTHNEIIREKQNEILNIERKISRLNEQMNFTQVELEKYDMKLHEKEYLFGCDCLPYSEQLRELERKRIEIQGECDRYIAKIGELDSSIEGKQLTLEKLKNDIGQKIQELQELNEMIGENDFKYKKVIKDNRDALDKTLKELKEKEEAYHNILMDLDRLQREKENAQEIVESLDREIKSKDEILKKILINLENSQTEVKRLNENILNLIDKENNLVDILENLNNFVGRKDKRKERSSSKPDREDQ